MSKPEILPAQIISNESKYRLLTNGVVEKFCALSTYPWRPLGENLNNSPIKKRLIALNNIKIGSVR